MNPSPPPQDAASDPIYKVHNLIKNYDSRCILSIDALDIFHGEILALVGPSGSGKSTFLRLLNFLEPQSSGEIFFRGHWFKPGSEVPLNLRRRVTMVFQKPFLLNRSVWENVIIGLKLHGLREKYAFAMEVLMEVGLDGLARQSARTLSGGEAQRVAMARAMVLQPDVLLLDEPTANLDPYNVGLLENIIQRLSQQHKTTLVLVTHNVFQAQRLANRTAFLLNGKIVEVANKDAFFNHPGDPRTRAFISGKMVY